MNQIELLNQLLDDMDMVRPVAIAARPDDNELRSATRRMISALEEMRQSPGIPYDTYIWMSQQFTRLLDAEHGPLLRPTHSGTISSETRTAVEAHVQHRQQLLMEAQQDIPVTHQLLDYSCSLIGNRARKRESLQGRARHLTELLKERLKHDAGLRTELQSLIEAFTPSLQAISNVLEEAGEESPELKQAKLALEQELPEDIGQAREILQSARQSILQAGNKLTSASAKLHETIAAQVQSLSQLSEKLEQAESEARNDPLTGLANRRRLAEFLKRIGQSGFCFLVVDIDFFKKINDTYGHDAGDEILQQVASVLSESTRSSDLAARVGGEEFCIIFPEISLSTSQRLADTLRQSIEMKSFRTQEGSVNVTVSIGIAEHKPGTDHSTTFKAADEALYQSKRNGRNQVTIAK